MVNLSENDEELIGLVNDYYALLKEYYEVDNKKLDLLYSINMGKNRLFGKYNIRVNDNEGMDVFYQQDNGLLELIELTDVKLIEDLFDMKLDKLKRGVYTFNVNGD